jgi:ribosomal protein L25 (general stress protein Ctc)
MEWDALEEAVNIITGKKIVPSALLEEARFSEKQNGSPAACYSDRQKSVNPKTEQKCAGYSSKNSPTENRNLVSLQLSKETNGVTVEATDS